MRTGEERREEREERREERKEKRGKRREERDVGITCVIIYDDLALEAWTRRERERERSNPYQGLTAMLRARMDIDNKHRLGISSQRVLEKTGKLTVPVWYGKSAVLGTFFGQCS